MIRVKALCQLPQINVEPPEDPQRSDAVDGVDQLAQTTITGPLAGEDQPPECWPLISFRQERSLALFQWALQDIGEFMLERR